MMSLKEGAEDVFSGFQASQKGTATLLDATIPYFLFLSRHQLNPTDLSNVVFLIARNGEICEGNKSRDIGVDCIGSVGVTQDLAGTCISVL